MKESTKQLVKALVAKANYYDSIGQEEAADMVDKEIARLIDSEEEASLSRRLLGKHGGFGKLSNAMKNIAKEAKEIEEEES